MPTLQELSQKYVFLVFDTGAMNSIYCSNPIHLGHQLSVRDLYLAQGKAEDMEALIDHLPENLVVPKCVYRECKPTGEVTVARRFPLMEQVCEQINANDKIQRKLWIQLAGNLSPLSTADLVTYSHLSEKHPRSTVNSRLSEADYEVLLTGLTFAHRAKTGILSNDFQIHESAVVLARQCHLDDFRVYLRLGIDAYDIRRKGYGKAKRGR